jgi:predicted ATP-dependent serine protease
MEIQGIKFNTKVVREQKKRTSVPYEFEGLNWITEGGNCLGDLVVLIGNTGLGKSTLATQMVGYWWREKGYKTLIYSGEMDAASVINDLSLQ